VPADLFDMPARALRRDRAFKQGPELFLHERAFEDCLERIALHDRSFLSCLLIGCPDPNWPARLGEVSALVEVADPGPLFANAAGGAAIVEDSWTPPAGEFDLCVAIGTLDSVNDLPRALQAIRQSLKNGSLLIGVVSGGNTLPQLRSAMHAADQVMGASSPHVHPRIEAAAVAPLLTASGFAMPVVDVDRVEVTYSSLEKLVSDLRVMAATNILKARSRRPLSRMAREAATAAFEDAGDGGRTTETFEIIHFAAWTPPERPDRQQG
jgi:NADH dehydrogenase [ubiquinone] 1 alpha subcomplex assembly factor 5